MAGRPVVKAFFDLGLQVFGPEPHRERLALQRQTLALQHPEGIPGAVAHRQDQPFAGDVAPGGADPGQRAAAHRQPGEGGVEPHGAAQRFDLGPDAGNDPAQQVGAHMGFLPPGNVGGGAVAKQRGGDIGAQRVAVAGGELAVREGAGPALAELDVGVFIQDALGLKAGDGRRPLGQGRAPLQHQRAVTLAGQQQRGEKPGRAQPHHHRAVGQRRLSPGEGEFRPAGETDTGRGPGQSRFLTLVVECDGDGIHQHGFAVAGVHRKAGHAAPRSAGRRQAQQLAGPAQGFGLRVGAAQRQADVADQ